MARTATGYFRDRAAADTAYDDLIAKGFARDEISIVGRGREGGGLVDDDGQHSTAAAPGRLEGAHR